MSANLSMSAVKSTERAVRYHVVPCGGVGVPYQVVGNDLAYSSRRRRLVGHSFAVDMYRTRSAAEYAARLLNAGAAMVDRHATIGCKVVAR